MLERQVVPHALSREVGADHARDFGVAGVGWWVEVEECEEHGLFGLVVPFGWHGCGWGCGLNVDGGGLLLRCCSALDVDG